MTKSDKIRNWLAKHPNGELSALAEKFGVTKQLIYSVRKGMQDKVSNDIPAAYPGDEPLTKVSKKQDSDHGLVPAPIYLELVVPPAGLMLKVLDNPKHVHCTLKITRNGISHIPANGKKISRMLTWNLIRQIAAMGLIAKE